MSARLERTVFGITATSVRLVSPDFARRVTYCHGVEQLASQFPWLDALKTRISCVCASLCPLLVSTVGLRQGGQRTECLTGPLHCAGGGRAALGDAGQDVGVRLAAARICVIVAVELGALEQGPGPHRGRGVAGHQVILGLQRHFPGSRGQNYAENAVLSRKLLNF